MKKNSYFNKRFNKNFSIILKNLKKKMHFNGILELSDEMYISISIMNKKSFLLVKISVFISYLKKKIIPFYYFNINSVNIDEL